MGSREDDAYWDEVCNDPACCGDDEDWFFDEYDEDEDDE